MRADPLREPSTPHYRIYSPALSQAISVAQFLRRVSPGAHLSGVLLPGDGTTRGLGDVYDELISEATLSDAPLAVVIPTGAGSTRHIVAMGDVTVGDITLTAQSLRFSDKSWALGLAEAAGVPVPLTWTNVDSIPAWPVFYKSAEESDDRRRGLAGTPERLPVQCDGLIFQEVIAGDGTYGVGFLAHRGEMLASHAHFERESFPRLGGSAVLIERVFNPRLEALTHALVKASNYSGWGLAEFKYCPRRDDFVFMEINAKLWASWELALLNEPAFARHLFGVSNPPANLRRMVFLELALRRGPGFWPKLLAAVLRGDRLKVYPGWPRQALAAFVPRFLFPLVKRLAG